MENMSNIFMFAMPILVLIIWIGAAWYAYRQHKSIMDRARKIDPTVKTRAEAEYVLKKDIAESMGRNNIK